MDLNNKYKHILNKTNNIDAQDPRLLIDTYGDIEIFYAPFEHINTQAKLVIVGITPGAHQANISLNAYRDSINSGNSKKVALITAKETASFSGPMRKNLIDILNYIGIHNCFSISNCSELFDQRSNLVHFTSALRNPTFKKGKNYSGSPKILNTGILRKHLENYFFKECHALRNALYLPLGAEVESILKYAIELNILSESQILFGMPHPSGANAERISYFLDRKQKENLSAKTNADIIDSNKKILLSKINKL